MQPTGHASYCNRVSVLGAVIDAGGVVLRCAGGLVGDVLFQVRWDLEVRSEWNVVVGEGELPGAPGERRSTGVVGRGLGGLGGAGDGAAAARGRGAGARLLGPAEVVQLFRAVLCTVRRRMEQAEGRLPTPGEALGVMLDHAFSCWGGLDGKLATRHKVFARDGWRCAVPGCTSMQNRGAGR